MAKIFRWGEHIGSGGFGTVDEAFRIDDDGTVLESGLARKKLLDEWLGDDEAVARFKKEVRLLDEMEHENILSVEGRNLSDSPPWFVMPFAESNLDKEIDEHAGDREWVVERFSDILAGMEYAHNREVIHRDLKPENILIVDGVVKVADFGLGKRLDSETTHLTQTNIGMGPLAYMAPEQLQDSASVGAPADIYSLGKILGEMLTGTMPQMGRPRLDDYPAEYQGFIGRCTQDEPSARYANAEDARAAFQLLVSGGGATGDVSGNEFDDLLKKWEVAPLHHDDDEARAVANALVARKEDEEFFFRVIPRLPLGLMNQLIKLCPDEFDAILRAYNQHIEGSLPFEYCDVVANFYRNLYRFDTTLSQKRLILSRLIELGPGHNRWHVGEVFGDVVSGLSSPEEIRMAAEVICENPADALWNQDYVVKRSPDQAIREAYDSLPLV
jgi:eukaryotic-like serine/threonine-protein kinase